LLIAVGTRPMPILLYFVVVGSGLLGLLLGVNAMLPEGPPAVISSNFAGLPKLHPHQVTDLPDVSTAPAPDMRSPEVLAAAPYDPAVKSREAPVAVAIAAPKPKKHKVARRAPELGQYAAVAQNPDEGPHFGWGNRPAWGQSDDQARDQQTLGSRQGLWPRHRRHAR